MSATTKPDLNPRHSYRIFSRITHRWWLIAHLWLGLSVPTMYLVNQLVKPTYEAFSIVWITPNSWKLYEPSDQIDLKGLGAYLQTQIGLITSDRVLAPAIASSEIVKLTAITASDDPKAFLREKMKVEIVPDAYLIRVALELENGVQAAKIVNAVVSSYLEYSQEHQRSGYHQLRNALADQLEKHKTQIDEKRSELKRICEAGTIVLVPGISANASGKVSDPTRPRLSTVTEAQSQRIADEMLNSDLDLIKAQSILEVTEAASNAENDSHAREILSDLRLNVAALLKQRKLQDKYFDGLKVQMKIKQKDPSEAAFVQHQLEILMKREDQVQAHLKQLEFASQANVRVLPLEPAVAPKAPTTDNEFSYMAAAPLVVLVALLGLFLLVPIKVDAVSRARAESSTAASPAH